MDSKEYNLTLRDIRANLQSLLKDAVTARDGQREKLKAIHALSSDYTREFLERKLQAVEAEIAASNAELHARASKILENWSQTMQERHEQPVDLSDTALSSAINLVTVAGQQLEYQDLRGLVDGFRGNPPALRALRAVFEARGLSQGVALVQERTYDPAAAVLAIKGAIDGAFKDNGSINQIAYHASKVFEVEGLDFERTPDPQGVTEALRAGAGLPPLA